MPQHTSTRQTPNTAGAADGEVLPPDTNNEPTPKPAGKITTPEATPEASDTESKSEAGAGSSAVGEGKADADSSPAGEGEADTSAGAATKAGLRGGAKTRANPSAGTGSKAEAVASTSAKPETGLHGGAETQANRSASTGSKAKAGTSAAADTGAGLSADADGKAKARTSSVAKTKAERLASVKSKAKPSAGAATKAGTLTGTKTEAGASTAVKTEVGSPDGAAAKAGSPASAEPEAAASLAAKTEQVEASAPEQAVEAPPEATAEAAPGTASDATPDTASSIVQSRTTEDSDATTPEAADTEAPDSEVTEKATPDAEPDASATDPDTSTEAVTAPGTGTEAAADSTPDPTEATTPRPKRPNPRTWSSRLGLRRRMHAWREKHPVAALTLSWVVTFLAAVLVYICLEMPNTLGQLRLMEFARIPAEAIMAAVILLSLPRRARIIVAAGFGALVGAIAVLNMFDMGFNEYLGRHFNIILDWSLFGDARGYLKDTFGGTATQVITVGLIALIVVLIALVALAMVRLSNVLVTYKAIATKGTLIAGTVWITLTAFALEFHGIPLAADHTAGVIKYQVRAVQETLRDEAEFKKVAKVDAFGNTPGSQLVPDLRGKDMIFTFIESYGRSAIEDPIMAPGVDSTLAADTKALSKAGFAAKSGWLTSATYGGSSWLGHSTTMSGLWVSNQQRYRTVMASDHLSLTDAFKKTGDYDTVGVMPGIQKGWPEQSFYGLDKVYNAFQLGYQGPKFSWSTMPDQYALEQFQKQVHSKPRTDGKSLMSLLILTSSHQPWAPIPKLVPWDQLGNGSIFDSIEKAGNKASSVIADTTKSRQEYGKSIQYSVNSLTQWLERYGNDNTVLVFLGDHQPIARVSGNHASRDVPISIVAKDPKILQKIDSWNWTDGLRPAHKAPVWKMSDFRDKFLTAYGSTPHPKTN
ncbi:sulfatase-like hydrolase/transferase [Streptomyces sp. NPDC051554]|uniref:sulfatase-like hydrolase/transferase n=1 Tax=Streptomyces sp. NPDC051554 TaxID=3365656 RepID=UPI003795B570